MRLGITRVATDFGWRFLIWRGVEVHLTQRLRAWRDGGYPCLKLQDVFDDAVGELAFRGGV